VSQWVDPINSASMMISLFVIVFLGSYLFRETGLGAATGSPYGGASLLAWGLRSPFSHS
jgi:hypothetical protein